ncbi:MAG TPA: hypothetical protein VGO58_11960 [Chitinophagaceae bacterium]|nr:hypothetical protein [Chitinophagaceae bacterium]
MKRVLLILSSAVILVSCGGGKSEKKETKTDDKVSAEMTAFMGKLTGNSDNTAAALKEFGKDSLVTSDMEMYNLEEPKVLETNGNCYLFQAKSGMTKRKYNVCWEAGKIASVEDKGME